ncbi:hypothetical protein PRIPAC_88444 [Pristionchus pacificus]|uniref:Uncharacterized protein n=1 Tax=Pristionchus pacificus TaxID=54126 RepID=A0A2A6B8E5_PRIPA|nr:hypothetical protein PRIPAC_88444 [Pristionchus pacificus]|eukprot:PDM62149.1 hypothetical protein PRIPAC_51591 [Pristionchus pacificus]
MSEPRIKKCFLCLESAPQTRRFPQSSKPDEQLEWLQRQNRDEEGFEQLLNRHRTVKEPRWCLRHFTSPTDSLPTDMRPDAIAPPPLLTVPLRTSRPTNLIHQTQFSFTTGSQSGNDNSSMPPSPSFSALDTMIVKVNPELTPIYQKFFNHLYYVHNKYTERKDRPYALELVRSFLMHIQGKHKWEKNDEFQLVTQCEHGRLREKDNGETATLNAGTEEFEAVRKVLYAPRFNKAFLEAASLIDTSINESYHSLSLMYASKSSPRYYKLKMQLAMLHHNSLMLDDLLERRKEIGNTVLSRKARVVIAIKRKRGAGTHTWRHDILEESIKVRIELSNTRTMRLLGIPEDDVFDVLNAWWEEKEVQWGLEMEWIEEESDEEGAGDIYD